MATSCLMRPSIFSLTQNQMQLVPFTSYCTLCIEAGNEQGSILISQKKVRHHIFCHVDVLMNRFLIKQTKLLFLTTWETNTLFTKKWLTIGAIYSLFLVRDFVAAPGLLKQPCVKHLTYFDITIFLSKLCPLLYWVLVIMFYQQPLWQ